MRFSVFEHVQTDRERAAEALAWRYGPERARLKVEGRCPIYNADLAAWRRLRARAA